MITKTEDAKRLEEIKSRYALVQEPGYERFDDRDAEWLISQAEKLAIVEDSLRVAKTSESICFIIWTLFKLRT